MSWSSDGFDEYSRASLSASSASSTVLRTVIERAMSRKRAYRGRDSQNDQSSSPTPPSPPSLLLLPMLLPALPPGSWKVEVTANWTADGAAASTSILRAATRAGAGSRCGAIGSTL